ncbi:MAG: DegT/DnrJ/EryC1/StrS family aminotransferase [Chitinophagaceae bacterium]|nr:DegT/DnrJ/EryC1/StrS family aminotransferase [Chitinophagaceae bacterium]
MNNKPAILGGPQVRTAPFPKRRTMGEEEKQAVNKVMDSDVLSAFFGSPGELFLGGPKVKEFENNWARQYGFKHAISVNSWTSGLMIALGSAGVEPGDEVICSCYTMSASASCCFFYGAIPVFADVDPETYCIDPDSFEKLITPRTKAIIVVHLFGGAASMDRIMAIAAKHGIKVIEDAAQSPGILYKGKPLGAIGDIGGFSLNYHKHIHTGEGGMLATNDDEIAQKARMIRNHGENCIETTGVEDFSNFVGGNFRLTELQAAIGIEQLKKLDRYLKIRQELAAYFTEKLSAIPGLDVKQNDNPNNSYYMYPFKYHSEVIGLPRTLFIKAVLAELPAPSDFEDTALAGGYLKPLYLNPIYQKQIAIGKKGFPFTLNAEVKYNYAKGLCPVAERLYEKELLLSPLIREPLALSDVDDIVKAITKVVHNAAEIRAAFPDVDDSVNDYV